MRETRSGRRIAAVGLVVGIASVGIAVWVLRSRKTLLPAPSHEAIQLEPVTELTPAQVATPSEPFVARRRKPPPEPYLPPYVKPPPLLAGVRFPNPRDVEIHFPRLFGRLVSAADAAPISDAVVGVPNEFDSGRAHDEYVLNLDDVRVVARTDSDGRFELAESVVGENLVASGGGFGAKALNRGWLGKSHEEPLVIALSPASRLDVRISDRAGSPKPGIEVRLIAEAFNAEPEEVGHHDRILMGLVGARRVTDEHGETSFVKLPAGVPFAAELWSAEQLIVRDPSELVLESGKTTSKEWRLGSGATVTGRVVDDVDQPIHHQTLWLTRRGVFLSSSARRASLQWDSKDEISRTIDTDVDGRFKIEDVTPGHWWLGVAPSPPRFGREATVDDVAIAPVAEAFDVDPQGDRVELLVRVHRGLYIRGKAVDDEGAPVLAALIATLASADSSFFAETSSDGATGEFVLGPLEPGDYSIHTDPCSLKSDATGHHVPGKPLRPIESLVVAAGRDDLILRFGSGGEIDAKAIRADTGADADATFCLARAAHPDECEITCFGSSASARFSSLAAGDYSVSAVTRDGRAGCVAGLHVTDGEILGSVVVRVDEGARLKLTYNGAKEEYAQVKIVVGPTIYGADGIHQETSSSFVAPAGKVTIRWSAGADRFEEEVELKVGETRELVWPREAPAAPTDQRR